MQDVLDEKDWSAEEWANKAGIASTSITRFLKHGKPVPSSITVGRLADVANSSPVFGSIAHVPLKRTVEVLYGRGRNRSMKEIPSPVSCTFAAYLTDDTGLGLGWQGGDLLFIDANVVKAPDDVVAFHLEGEVSVGRVIGDMLVYAEPSISPTPVKSAGECLGVVVGTFREVARKA